MRSMRLDAPGKLVRTNVDRPEPGPGEVLIRVSHSGVCGTDLKIYRGGIPVSYPRIMGHEMIGTVVAAGDGATVKAGTRIIVDPVIGCGHCYLCDAGRTNLCQAGALLGRDCDGGFSDYMCAPADAVFPLPDSIPDRCAPLIQVMTTCHHAQKLGRISAGESVLVIGLGVSGLLHVQLAKSRGAGQVIGITGSAQRRRMAEKLGADRTMAPGDDVTEKVMALTDGRGADVVIDSAGAMSTLAQSIELARPGGRLLLFGIYTFEQATLPFYELYFKELEIINARAATRGDYPACIELVGSGQVDLEPMISHVLPLNELDKAIEMLQVRDESRMKVILEHS